MCKPNINLRIKQNFQRGISIKFIFNKTIINAFEGETIATALLANGIPSTKFSVGGQPRGPVCLMGSCQECAVRIDGRKVLACQTRVVPGLEVEIDGKKSDP